MTKNEKKQIEKVIKLLAHPSMKWDEAMTILFKLIGRKYPFRIKQ